MILGTGDTAALRLSYTIELSQLHVHVPRAEEFQNEFSITSSVRSCTLRARDLKERNEWLEALNSAIEEFRSRKATFLAMDQLSGFAGGDEEHVVGDSAPVWIPDQRVTMCQACSSEFGLVVRRHHCRACGRVVCSPCSASKAPLRYRQFQAGRVCDICFEALEKGIFVTVPEGFDGVQLSRSAHGDCEELKDRFKRRDTARPTGRYVPQVRLEIERWRMRQNFDPTNSLAFYIHSGRYPVRCIKCELLILNLLSLKSPCFSTETTTGC